MKIKYIGLLISLFMFTACAPVVHNGGYGSQRSSIGYAYFHHEDRYAEYNNRYAHSQRYHPIEVTLYADSLYGGLAFQPFHFIFYDGDYVQIPIKDRRGRHARVYAHYHRGDLHFDRDKNCNNLSGASRFRYDKRWDKGHRYDHVSAGHEFDLNGLRLNVRKHTEKKRTDRKKNLVNEKGIHNSPDMRKLYQRSGKMRAASTSAGIGRDKTKQKVSFQDSVNKNNVRKVKKVKSEIDLPARIDKHQKREKLHKKPNKHIQTEKLEKNIKRTRGEPDRKKSIYRKDLKVKQHVKNKHEKSSKSKSRNNTKKKERKNEEEKTDTVQGYVANSEQNDTRRVKFKHINCSSSDLI